jgi:hypothetical protein
MRWILSAALLASMMSLGVPAVPAAEDKKDDFLAPANWVGEMSMWKFEGNTIVGTTDGKIKSNTFLCSKQKYTDFELTFQVRLKGGVGNSGVQVRSKIDKEGTFVVAGPQCDIGAGYWGSLYGEKFGGMMKEAPKDAVNAKLKKDDFNEYSIKVVGKKVTILVNGVSAVDQDFEKLPADGIIAWQLHTGPAMEVTFKDIKFTNLAK